jgi:phenylacetate-coenzyme A ligase PaaK-like adenylate-forming protein
MLAARSFLDWPIYGLDRAAKRSLLAQHLAELVVHHRQHCEPYARVLEARGMVAKTFDGPEDIPFLPVRLFKDFELRSVPAEQVFKVLTSSGTTSQQVSRIILDKETAQAQSKALVRILQEFLGKDRQPMLIIDHPGVLKDRRTFSARAAGIMGFSSFGRDHTYALRDEDMGLDVEAVSAFLAKHKGKRVLLFGFTYMVWQHFVNEVVRLGLSFDFSDGLLIHGGGWKKLAAQAVTNEHFKDELHRRLGLKAVHNYYGMVEQVGSIFMECEHGRLHTPSFADVIIRRGFDWSVAEPGQSGLIQVLSLLPRSYPGHSLLTEDVGMLLGEDDCPCGRLGKTFSVTGRIARAELRGCSDTYATDHSSPTKGAT